ncbi:RanBP2-type zinc finger protein [Zea mays]|uniref:RanBP2-type zinc finger protein n=1 Tax=Zea mays TaxID=4577 RepID=A0A1D6EVX3_MAIZE|nr:RanBP2-type zinc finger protein [Zea mays]
MMPAPPAPGYDRLPLFYGGGGGAPSPISLGSGSYGGPYPHLGMRYGYGPPVGAPGSYGLFSSYGQPGPMSGMGYGPGPELGRYSYGFRGSPMPALMDFLRVTGPVPNATTLTFPSETLAT